MNINFFKNKTNRDLFLIVLSIIIGGLTGIYFPKMMVSIEWIGKIFMNTLMMLVLPLVFFSLVSAITSIGNITKLGKLGKLTFIAILINVACASLLGLALALILKPGHGIDESLLTQGNMSTHTLASEKTMSFSNFIVGMFPPNLGDVAIKSQILPIVIFGIFFSIIALKNLNKKNVENAISTCNGFKEILMNMLGLVMQITPIAMFSLIGNALASAILSGQFMADILGIFKFILVFIIGCILLCTLQFILLLILVKKEAFSFLSNTIKSPATGFATSSSLATLPIMLLSAKEANIDESVAKFTLPLTVVFNLGSSALYVAVATLFVSQVLHINLSITEIFLIYITTVITGMGTTGIPNAGFIATMTVLKTISVPTSAITILFPIDTVLGRIRTAVNIWGHLVCAYIVDYILRKKKK